MKQRIVIGGGGGGEYGRVVNGEVERGGGRASGEVEEVEKLRRGIECLMMIVMVIKIEVLHQVRVIVIIVTVLVMLLLLLIMNAELHLLLQFGRHGSIASDRGGDKGFLSGGGVSVREVLHGQMKEMHALF